MDWYSLGVLVNRAGADPKPVQVVEAFLIDVDKGAAYSLPGNLNESPDRINADK